MSVKAFIFDLDGVLTDTAACHFIAWKAVANSFDIRFDEQDNERLKGVDRENSLTRILAKSNIVLSDTEFNNTLIKKNNHYIELINNLSADDVFSGVLSCFEKLKKLGIKIGLASASKNADFVVEKLKIIDYFDFLGDANKIKLNKPAPDIFLSVAIGLNILPIQCVGIEDAIAGISAIKSANMFAVGVGARKTLTQADIIYNQMSDLNIDEILVSFAGLPLQ